jgi:hypothetical protein
MKQIGGPGVISGRGGAGSWRSLLLIGPTGRLEKSPLPLLIG